ncbi:MAG: right-handed parallel beta-helix repeat-containing protein, partial [Candidatus Thorarchaeota archaeon]
MYNYESYYNIIANNTCNENVHAIYLDGTAHTTVSDNTCTGNFAGVTLRYSGFNTIERNTFVDGGLYMFATGTLDYARQTSVVDNTVNGLPVVFWQDIVGGTVPTGSGQVVLVNCIGVSVVDQTISGAVIGIQLILSEDCVVSNCVSTNNFEGIRVDSSSFNIIEDNVVMYNDQEGIHVFWHSDSNIVRRNICRENKYGIYLLGADLNTVTNNTCLDNEYGIYARSDSYDNIIEWNALIDNTVNALAENVYNTFDYNYYSDYSGLDMDGNGIGDTPYFFSPSVDNHPLMLPIGFEPVWLIEPSNPIAEYTLPFSLQLYAAAAPPGITNWWVNDTDNFAIDMYGALTNVTFLPKGEYGLEVSLSDSLGHILTAEFTVIVINNLPPNWDEVPQDLVLYPWDTLHYNLNASDPSGIDMWWLEDTTYFTIDQDGIVTNTTPFSEGYYIVQVFVNDTLGNVLDGTFTIFADFDPPHLHGAIRIDGDDDFHSQAAVEGWPGFGTQGDPYRIENWEIRMGGTGHCIEIRNTRVHFVVQGCLLEYASVSQHAGIYLYNVTDGALIDNILLQNWAGIRLTNSSRINIDSNDCTNSVWYSIWLEVDSTYNRLFNNTCVGAGTHAIYLYDGCAFNEILNNTISNIGDNGIRLEIDCGHSIVANNTVMARFGIVLSGAPNSIVIFNNCSYNSYEGIYIINSDICTVANNTCIDNNRHGVAVIWSNYVTVANNTLSENTNSGIIADGTTYSTVVNNVIDNNGQYGVWIYSSSSYIDVVNNVIINNSHNLLLQDSTYCTVTDNICSNSDGYGLYLLRSNYNTIANNTSNDNGNRGICLEYSSYNNVMDNICDDNTYFGIVLYYSNINLVENNTCNNGASEGAHIRRSSSNTIANNTFS